MTDERRQHFGQLDAIRGLAALMVVFNHFALVEPLRWIWRTPLRFLAAGHEAVILFFILSGFVLTLQLTSQKNIGMVDFIIKRICRIYLPYIFTIFFALFVMYFSFSGTVEWAGPWVSSIWTGIPNLHEILQHVFFLGDYDADKIVPVIWSLIYEMRISLIFPILILIISRFSATSILTLAILISILSFSIMSKMGINTTKANFYGEWAITLHYIGVFLVGSLTAMHRKKLTAWLGNGRRPVVAFVISILFYFLSRALLVIVHGPFGQMLFDWGVALGAVGIVCCAMISRRLTAGLAWRPVVFLGKISYSLYLIHTVVLLAIIHLFADKHAPAVALVVAAALILPAATLLHIFVERPSMRLGKFLTK